MNSTKKPLRAKHLATKELALLTALLFFGLVVMPFIIYTIGESIFGAYGGLGYADFFGTLTSKIRSGDIVAWFLVLSPYLGWQCLRLMTFALRVAGSRSRRA